jgi:hypothetical protein
MTPQRFGIESGNNGISGFGKDSFEDFQDIGFIVN